MVTDRVPDGSQRSGGLTDEPPGPHASRRNAQPCRREPGQEEPTLDAGLALVDRWWRAANYLSVGQIYLRSNPLLREPLSADDTKSRLLGHWGTTPGLNFVYAHLNRVIRRDAQEMLFIAGPGHGGPAVVANAWLEGTYSEIYGHVGDDEARPGGAVPPVLLPRRHPQPRRPGDARVHQRRRRARVLAGPRLRVGVRQPPADHRRRDRRRRSGNRAAGGELALAQLPGSRGGRRRAAHPAPERLQDRQPHHPGPDAGGASWSSCSAATGTSRTSSRWTIRTTPRRRTATSPPPWTTALPKSAPSRQRRRGGQRWGGRRRR